MIPIAELAAVSQHWKAEQVVVIAISAKSATLTNEVCLECKKTRRARVLSFGGEGAGYWLTQLSFITGLTPGSGSVTV